MESREIQDHEFEENGENNRFVSLAYERSVGPQWITNCFHRVAFPQIFIQLLDSNLLYLLVYQIICCWRINLVEP
jgi:hypothetical protein